MLSLDFACVRFTGAEKQTHIEVIRTKNPTDDSRNAAVRAAIAPLLHSDVAEIPASIPNPFGNGLLQIAITRFGIGEDIGVLITAAHRAEFPSEQDRLLLGVGANQTAIVLGRKNHRGFFTGTRRRYRELVTATSDVVYVMNADWSEDATAGWARSRRQQ